MPTIYVFFVRNMKIFRFFFFFRGGGGGGGGGGFSIYLNRRVFVMCCHIHMLKGHGLSPDEAARRVQNVWSKKFREMVTELSFLIRKETCQQLQHGEDGMGLGI